MNVRLVIAVIASMTCVAVSAAAQTPVTLEWDTHPDGSVRGYVVYVGESSGSYTERHDVGDRTTFTYTKALFGRPYYFAVAAYAAGFQIGAPSEEVLFLSGAAVSTPSISASPVIENNGARASVSPAAGPQVACGTTCLGAELIASVPGRADSMVVADHRRLLFLENGTRVRAIVDGTLVPRPLLDADGAAQLMDLVLDPDYARTKFIYLAVAERRADGVRQLSLVRYREVGGQLGEGAVVVTGLPLPATGDAAVAMDAARRFYVAMPSALEGEPGASRYAGMILRFESDGATVRDDGSVAPVYSRGYAKPASMAWSASANALWLAGTGADWRGTMAFLATEAPDSGPRPVLTDGGVPGATVISLSSAGHGSAAPEKDPGDTVFVDEAGGIFRSTLTPDGVFETSLMAAGARRGTPTSIARDLLENAIYIAVAQPDTLDTQIFKLHSH